MDRTRVGARGWLRIPWVVGTGLPLVPNPLSHIPFHLSLPLSHHAPSSLMALCIWPFSSRAPLLIGTPSWWFSPHLKPLLKLDVFSVMPFFPIDSHSS